MSLVTALEAPLSISNAIRKASRATGADFTYLLKTAARESSFNKSAKAKTSSAAGLFQFIEATWLRMVKEAGGKFGLDKYTPHIFSTRSGKYYVPNKELRQEILQLRHNPEVSAMMAGEFTRENSDFVKSEIGREPTPGELYIAHFLGAKGAADFIQLAESKPNARADRHFASAARANRSIFYSRGKPRSLSQVYNVLVSHHAKLKATAAGALPAAPAVQVKPIAAPQIVKPVAAPVESVAPVPQQAPSLLHKASVANAPAAPEAQTASLATGVETKVVEDAASAQAVGLLGQKGSPISTSAKVAALTHNNLNIAEKTISAPKEGSIGVWTTIIEPPRANADSIRDEKTGNAPAGEAARPGTRPTSKRKVSTREPRLLEQSASRNARSSASRTTLAAGRDRLEIWQRPDFWEYVSQNSG